MRNYQKAKLLHLIGELADEAKGFGVYEQYSEAGDELHSSSERVYELTGDIVFLVTGKRPSVKEMEQVLYKSVGDKDMHRSEDEE